MPTPVTTEFHLNPDKNYLLIRQTGALDTATIKAARQQTRPLFDAQQINRALVDYRQANLSRLTLLELDNLAEEFHQDLPRCRYMAIVYASDAETERFIHIKNVCLLNQVNAELFDDIEQAERWLTQR